MQATATNRRPRIVAGVRLVGLVGGGGEGEVWEARDRRGRRRALKLIRPQSLADPEQIRQRGQYLLRIDHPALVRVHRGGQLANGPLAGWGFVEMDYIDGQALTEAQADADVLARLAPLAEALDLLHAGEWSDGVPLIHRDVKPANLIRTPPGALVLVDASTLRGVDATHLTRIGTPVFCAPEVVTGRIGPPADVYSFAVTAVALLTGARGQALADLLDEAPRLDLPDGVRRALLPQPSRRPSSCRAVLDATIALAAWGPQAWEPDDSIRLDLDDDADAHPGALVDDDDGSDGEWEAEDDEEYHEAVLAPRRAALIGWLAVLGLVVGAPAAAAGFGLVAPVIAIAAGVTGHLGAQLAARQPLLLGVLAPPAAWAFLLAERAAPAGRRRAWAAAQLLGALLMAAAAPAAYLAGGAPSAVAALAAGGGLLTVAAAWAPSLQGAAGGLWRALLAPLWLAGAAAIAVGSLMCLPFAMALGRARPLLATAGRALIGGVEILRGPRLPA